jgi:hypothetical protein
MKLTIPDDAPSISVGDKIRVGEHFWISYEHIIGWDTDAHHGNGSSESGGSADGSCTVTVRAIRNNWAIVRLDRDSVPYGAKASIGTVFQVPVSKILSWPAMTAARIEHEKQRKKLASQYLR